MSSACLGPKASTEARRVFKGLQVPQPRGLPTQRPLHARLYDKLGTGEEGAPGISQASLLAPVHPLPGFCSLCFSPPSWSSSLDSHSGMSDSVKDKFSIAFSIVGMFASHAVGSLSVFFCAEITPTVIR